MVNGSLMNDEFTESESNLLMYDFRFGYSPANSVETSIGWVDYLSFALTASIFYHCHSLQRSSIKLHDQMVHIVRAASLVATSSI